MNKKWLTMGVGAGAALIAVVPTLKRRASRITNILKKDHRVVSGLFLSLETVGRTNSRLAKSIFEQIHNEVEVHAQAEEEIFYTAVARLEFGSGDSRIAHSREEHQQIRELMSEISSLEPGSSDFVNKTRTLKEKIQHHVDEEESRIFQIATDQLYPEELEEMGRRFASRKKQLKQRYAAA